MFFQQPRSKRFRGKKLMKMSKKGFFKNCSCFLFFFFILNYAMSRNRNPKNMMWWRFHVKKKKSRILFCWRHLECTLTVLANLQKLYCLLVGCKSVFHHSPRSLINSSWPRSPIPLNAGIWKKKSSHITIANEFKLDTMRLGKKIKSYNINRLRFWY